MAVYECNDNRHTKFISKNGPQHRCWSFKDAQVLWPIRLISCLKEIQLIITV